ncbi:MAG: glycosyltransferase family 2 protein [Gemmatimonadota bacterium]
MIHPVELSIVVPLFNEAENVDPLVERVREALEGGPTWELLLVDDGSRDGTPARMDALARADHRVRPIHLARNYGQTTAMQAGFDHARGRIVVSMDGDLQNDPLDIPRLIETLDKGYDLVTGYRENRQDRFLTRKVPSWIANRIIRWLTAVPIRDNGCSLKAYRAELVQRLHLYSDMHRFIPAIAVATAGARIAEIPVMHHARRHGVSKYGLSRTWKVLSDLLVIKTIRSFRERPLILFGIGALIALGGSLVFGVRSVITAVDFGRNALVFPSITALLMGLSVYLLMLGLLAESALGHIRRRAPTRAPLMTLDQPFPSGPAHHE